MDPIDQRQAFGEDALPDGDQAHFWRSPGHGNLECLTAQFQRYRYLPHTHETYVVGVVVAGCETYMLRGVRRYAPAGALCFVHPGDVHDGEPHGVGYAYRMVYPAVDFLRDLAGEVTGRAAPVAPSFREAVAQDHAAAAGFVAAHRALSTGDEALADEQLLAALGRILVRHADVGPPLRLGRERGPVDRVRAYIEDHHAEEIDLTTLAGVAGLSRFHLVRAFRKETGLTPHAWLTDARVRAGRRLLAAGRAPGEVAAACGFADQSHLTRAFKARVGVTPGAFRAALHGRRSARAA